MPEFGKYAIAIYSAYGVTIGVFAGLVVASWWRWRTVKRDLEKLEDKRHG